MVQQQSALCAEIEKDTEAVLDLANQVREEAGTLLAQSHVLSDVANRSAQTSGRFRVKRDTNLVHNARSAGEVTLF